MLSGYPNSVVMIGIDELFASGGLSLERLRSFLSVVDAGGISKAAEGDPTRQSQFSRQIKELEGFFGVALTRRVGKGLEITEEGKRLADMARVQLRELSNFRSIHTGGRPALRLGCSGSVTQWLVIPRLKALRDALRGASIDLLQMRSKELVRAVTDGRIDLGVVRSDALRPHSASVTLGCFGYSLFGPKRLARGAEKQDVADLLRSIPLVQVLAGGRFEIQFSDWLEEQEIETNTIARVSSFTACAEAVIQNTAGAVLPDLAATVMEGRSIFRKRLELPYQRELALVGNLRALDRVGFGGKHLKVIQSLLTDG